MDNECFSGGISFPSEDALLLLFSVLWQLSESTGSFKTSELVFSLMDVETFEDMVWWFCSFTVSLSPENINVLQPQPNKQQFNTKNHFGEQWSILNHYRNKLIRLIK